MPVTGSKYCEVCKKDVSKKNWSRHIKTKEHCENTDVHSVVNNLEKKKDKKKDKKNPERKRDSKCQNFFCTFQKYRKYRIQKYYEWQIRNKNNFWIKSIIVGNEWSGGHEHSHAVVTTQEKINFKTFQIKWKSTFKCRVDDLQSCKKVKDAVRYVSKEDHLCIFDGVDKDHLSLKTKCYYWAYKSGFRNTFSPAMYPYCNLSTQQQRQWTELWRFYCEEDTQSISVRQLERMELRLWQTYVDTLLQRQTDREILWIWDTVGNTGKTWMSNYISSCKGGIVMENGKTSDIAYAYGQQRIVVFDYSRSQEERVNYHVLECFKNGRLFSPKYDSKVLTFKSVKLLVLANFKPDFTKLSMDRWCVYEIAETPVFKELGLVRTRD